MPHIFAFRWGRGGCQFGLSEHQESKNICVLLFPEKDVVKLWSKKTESIFHSHHEYLRKPQCNLETLHSINAAKSF